MTDTRETLAPIFESLARERSGLVWDISYLQRYAPFDSALSHARAKLAAWDREHAEEWNRTKPWFEKRLPTDWKVGHHERMIERFKEKQRP